MLKRTIYPLLLALAAAWLATPAEGFQHLYRRAESGDANTVLLCHFDGTDGATTTTDSSLSAHAITLAGDAQLDTAQKQFGTAALSLDWTDSYASVPDSPSWQLGGGTGDYTVEAWVRVADYHDNSFSVVAQGSWSAGWNLVVYSSYIYLFFGNGSTLFSAQASGLSIPATEWHHIAAVRQSGVVRLFLDGVSKTFTTSGDPAASVPDYAAPLIIGRDPYPANDDGNIDELRISNVARYWDDFTPTGPFNP
jgi:hypothetical protein